MRVTKEKSDFGTNIFVEQNRKYIGFTYGGTGDLYWSIHNSSKRENANHETFTITKENYGVYHAFEQLFKDVEDIHIYDFDEDDIPYNLESEEEVEEYLVEREREQEKERINYRERNKSHYNDMFDPEAQTITWYSDEVAPEVSNILTIRKERETFELDFEIQQSINGYDEDNHSAYYIPIRFRNSGSKYEPLNTIFMKMYQNLKEVDDVKDLGHQMQMEEYLFAQDKKLVKKPN